MRRNLFSEFILLKMKPIAFASFTLALAFQVIAQAPAPNLIAYYPFCGSANDFSGNGINGTVIGAALTTDRFGNTNSAYTFNGTSDYIDLPPTNFLGLNIYSYSIWIRPSSNAPNTGLLAYSVGGNDPYCQSLSFNTTWAGSNNILGAGSYNVGSNPVQSYVLSNSLSGNAWIHVVVTRDMSDLKMYVNGVLLSTNTGSTSGQSANYGSTPPYKAVIGARSTLQSMYFFAGQIDDVRIYSSVLNQSDVNALYAETPLVVSVNSGSVCLGSSFTITPAGAASYTYSGGSAIVTPATSASYTVSGNTNNGCQAYAVSDVSVIPSPAIAISGPSVICQGQVDVLSASGGNNYTWSTGSAAPSITIAPLTNSVYSVTGSNSLGCSGSANLSLVVARCEGVDQQQPEEQGFCVYPNPNAGSFTVKLSAAGKRGCQFILTDMQGRVLKSAELNTEENLIDLGSEIASGCYFGKLLVNGKFIFTQKIIIQ